MFVSFNTNQKSVVVSSQLDVLFVNLRKDIEVDVDNNTRLGDIKCIIHIQDKFYILANKHQKQVGCYLIEIDENEPEAKEQYLLNWKNKLIIGDAQFEAIVNADSCGSNHLIMCFKSSSRNTYNIISIDLKTKMILFRHESE
jgi:protease II